MTMTKQLNETELEVSADASYEQRLEVLEQQEELIEDEAEQEQVRVFLLLPPFYHPNLYFRSIFFRRKKKSERQQKRGRRKRSARQRKRLVRSGREKNLGLGKKRKRRKRRSSRRSKRLFPVNKKWSAEMDGELGGSLLLPVASENDDDDVFRRGYQGARSDNQLTCS
jgi:hypothetical protein